MQNGSPPSRPLALPAAAALTAFCGCAIKSQADRRKIAPAVGVKIIGIYSSPSPCSSYGRDNGMTVGASARTFRRAHIDRQNHTRSATAGFYLDANHFAMRH